MRRLFLMLALFSSVAAPAHAARVWGEPAPITDAATQDVKLYVAGSTELAVWVTADHALVARYGSAAPVTLAPRVPPGNVPPAAVSRSGEAIVIWSAGDHTDAVAARPDGTFTDPADIGPGAAGAVFMNDNGDAEVSTTEDVAYRPAGGPFGAAVAMPSGGARLLGLTSDGVAFIGRSCCVARGADVFTRTRNGPIASTPSTTFVVGVSIVSDDHGRALAVSGGFPSSGIDTSVFADGQWSPPQHHDSSEDMYGVPPVAVDAAGDAVIAWRSVDNPAVRGMTGSLADGVFSDPVVLDADSVGNGFPVVASEPDGSTVIAYTDPRTPTIRAIRRDGTGPFGTPQVAACGQDVAMAGLDASANAVLQVGTSAVRDAFSATPVPERVCFVPETGPTGPAPSFSTSPIVVGVPVTIDYSGVRRPNGDLVDCEFDFADRSTPSAGPVIKHTFTKPGRQSIQITCDERSRLTGTTDAVFDSDEVDVFARAALSAPRRARRAVQVRANAFTGAEPARVTLEVGADGRVLGAVTRRLGAEPETVLIPLSRPPRGAARVVLRQHHRVRASARLRRKPVQ